MKLLNPNKSNRRPAVQWYFLSRRWVISGPNKLASKFCWNLLSLSWSKNTWQRIYLVHLFFSPIHRPDFLYFCAHFSRFLSLNIMYINVYLFVCFFYLCLSILISPNARIHFEYYQSYLACLLSPKLSHQFFYIFVFTLNVGRLEMISFSFLWTKMKVGIPFWGWFGKEWENGKKIKCVRERGRERDEANAWEF